MQNEEYNNVLFRMFYPKIILLISTAVYW